MVACISCGVWLNASSQLNVTFKFCSSLTGSSGLITNRTVGTATTFIMAISIICDFPTLFSAEHAYLPSVFETFAANLIFAELGSVLSGVNTA